LPDRKVLNPQLPALYTCLMHPDVVSDKPGKCPKCGMGLVPIESAPDGGKAAEELWLKQHPATHQH